MAKGRRLSAKFTTRKKLAKAVFDTLESRTLLSVGGGFTDAGIKGEYFANTSLSGTPSFTRMDNRIDFDWGTSNPGGSIDTAYAAVGDSFSARWSGQLIAAFSETYTFSTTADDRVRTKIRPAGTEAWTTLADAWEENPSAPITSTFDLIKGQKYDIQVDYVELGGGAQAKLHWSSPSTPSEVIEPLSMSGVNVHEQYFFLYADAFATSRDQWATAADPFGTTLVGRDENGWPLADAANVVWEGRSPSKMTGTYFLQFDGKAEVSISARTVTFTVDGVNYNTLPAGVGYDPVTNKTTALMKPGNDADILTMVFKNTQRTADHPLSSGITNVKLMRPTLPGASTYFPTDQLFDPNMIAALQKFTTLRWLTANSNTETNWSDRKRPNYSKANFARQEVWEYEVMVSNETGKDLYITIPMGATQEYVTNLANLIKYGSDGVNPYTEFQENPVYPGLNPNLNVYIEWSNEVWNWSFPQATQGLNAAAQAVKDNTPDGQILNYDGKSTGDFRKYLALKTVQTSKIFRNVFGDDQMMSRIRPVLEYQYDNAIDTAREAFKFIDNYFNNADGNHVADPHPVNYYLWGGGAAMYYDAGNPRGLQDEIKFTDGGFENYNLSPGTASVAPSGGGWNFTGNAGVYRENTHSPVAPVESLGTAGNSLTENMSVGYSFTTGNTAMGLYDIGRWVVAGNNQSHNVRVIRASDKAIVAVVTINTSGATPGTYVYGSLSTPVTLAANTTYYVMSTEVVGKDTFYNSATTVTPNPGITYNGAISATYTNASTTSNAATWAFTEGPAGNVTYGPVDIRVGQLVGNLSYVQDAPAGTNAVFIGDKGSISQTINFTKAGVFALEVLGANKINNSNKVRVYIDDKEITPAGSSIEPGIFAWTPGSVVFGRDTKIYSIYGTAPFTIDAPGEHTIKIVGTGSVNQYTFFDDIKVNSVDAIFESGIPAHWANPNSMAKYVQSWGLKFVAYEGGWAVGGDDSGYPVARYGAYRDPRGAQSIVDSIDKFHQAGGSLYMFGTFSHFVLDDAPNVDTYQTVKGIDTRSDTLPIDPTNGAIAPATLLFANRTWGQSEGTTGNVPANGWVAWNVVAPASGWYDVGVFTTTANGTVRLALDDATTIATGASNGLLKGSVYLTKGLHSIKVRNIGTTTFNVASAAIAQQGVPFGPSNLAVTPAGDLTWVDNASEETGYLVERSTSADFSTDLVTFTRPANSTSFSDTTTAINLAYYYRVRAVGENGNSVASATAVLAAGRTPENPYRDKAGLSYKYFEGVWTAIPNFDAMTPIKSGVTTNFDLALRNREDNFGLQFDGYIDIPTDGLYTFYTNSDDASKLYIGSTYVVNNDGNHGPRERSGQIRLLAGHHAFRVQYYDNTGGQSLTVSYSGPGITKKTIPTTALYYGGVIANTAPTVLQGPSALKNANSTAATLSVLGADDGGESDLTYAWSIVSQPEGANAVLPIDATNSNKSVDVAFDRTGTYTFQVAISDGMFTTTANVDVTINQIATTVAIDPAVIQLGSAQQQKFSATAFDQFGRAFDVAPTFTWSIISGDGTIDSTGLYTAGILDGSATVEAMLGSLNNTALVTITNSAPTVETQAFAAPEIVTGNSATLAVLGADLDGAGEEGLTYSWSLLDGAPAGVTFSINESHAAQQTLATFTKAGVYNFRVTITDQAGASVTSDVSVTVDQTITSIALNPASASVSSGATRAFSATAFDQFGDALAAQPAFTWAIDSGDGSIDSAGQFTAPFASGSTTISATSGDVSITAEITTANAAPTIVTVAQAASAIVTGTSVGLSVLAGDVDGGGESALIYAWTYTGPGGVIFSSNDSHSSKQSTATFATAGEYTFTVAATDLGGESTTSSVTVHVAQTFTSATILPASTNVASGGSTTFAVTAYDQFGSSLADQPAFTWSVQSGGGSIDSTGKYTAAFSSGSAIVKATSGAISATSSITISNNAPSIITPANANPSPVLGSSTSLSVLGTDTDSPASNLVYTWSTTGNIPAGVSFSSNGSNAAQNTIATFTKAGEYDFLVTITDLGGLSTTSGVHVIVNQTFTALSIAPTSPTVSSLSSQQFSASTKDQFGDAMVITPALTWSVPTGAGSISAGGLYLAPAAAGSATVRVSSGTLSSDANVTITNAAPTIVTGATASAASSTTASLAVLGGDSDSGGETNLTYTWATTGTPPPFVSFSSNGTNAAKNTIVTFTNAGTYNFLVTATDQGGRSTTSTVTYVVTNQLTSLAVSPSSFTLSSGGTRSFSAASYNQFGQQMATQPVTWSVQSGGGSFTPTSAAAGTYSAPYTAGTTTITATNGSISASANVTITNAAPTVATVANASPGTVTGTATNLAVLGADSDGSGESNLSYLWNTIGNPPAGVTFSANNSNAAKNTTATFTKAGTYQFQVTITDLGGLSTTSNVTVTVNQALTSLSLAPASTMVNSGTTTQFTASAFDQFNQPMTPPLLTWSVLTGGGSVNSSGLYTAPATAGSATVKAAAGAISAVASVTISNGAPIVATAASATFATTKTATLAVLGSDPDGAESNLTYTWSTTGNPPAGVTFSANGTNAAKNSVATFAKAGTYNLLVTIADAGGLSTTSSVTYIVEQYRTTITVTPQTTTIAASGTQQFSASVFDQFGEALTFNPGITWSMASGGGSINSTGLYTAPVASGSASVRATSGAISTTASITIANGAPTVATAASASPSTVTAKTTNLSVLGADPDSSESNLVYTWSTTGNPPAAVTFSANGTNAAKSTTATFARAGTYNFLVTITDLGGLSTTSSVIVTVNQTVAAIAVAPQTNPSVQAGATQQFTAAVTDQFGQSMSAPITWSVTGSNTINSTGLFTAGSTAGSFTVTATSGSTTGTAAVTVAAAQVPATLTLGALNDAFVRDGSYQNTVYNNTVLEVKRDGVGNAREAYLTFDLTQITAITTAKLRIYGKLSDPAKGGINVSLYDVTNTAWSESTLTYANRPASSTTAVATVNVPDKSARWFELDLTTYLKSLKSAGKTQVSFALKAINTGALATFNSKNATSNQPQLVVTQPTSTPQAIVVSTNSLSVNEGSSNSFTVKLATAPTSNVTISIARSGDTDLNSNVASLVFTPANWNTAQSVNVTAAVDADTLAGSATFTLSSAGLSNQTVTASEVDTTVAQGIVVSTNSLSVTEGLSNSFTVKLAAAPTSNVTISVTRSGDTDLNASVASLIFTPTNWNTAQTVNISAASDVDLLAGSATFTLASAGLTSQTVTTTEIDTTQPTPTNVTLAPIADAFGRDGTNQNTVYNSGVLEVKKDGTSNYRETYLKFDLTNVSTINSATLRLYGKLSDPVTGGINVSVYDSTNTTWSESTVNYATRPTTTTTALATANVPDRTQRWIEWDLTAYLQAQKAAGKTQITLVLKTATSGALITFNSKEAASNTPELKIT